MPAAAGNLFLATQRLTSSREDHLTEFFASALETAPGFAAAYLDLLLATRIGEWGPQRLVSLQTQAGGYEHAIPDLVLTVADAKGRQRLIAVEHKIEAQETESVRGRPVGDLDEIQPTPDPIRQLAWYLTQPIDGVAYVRESMKRPDVAVLAHERYIAPASGDPHFLWRVFHPLLEHHRAESLIVAWLADGFVQRGYTMPNAKIGDLSSQDESVRKAARENLRKLWQPMRTQAERMGWKTMPGSIHEVWLESHPTSSAKYVWVNPLHGTALVVRFTPWDGRDAPLLLEAIHDLLPRLTREVPLRHEPEVAIGTQRRQAGAEPVVQVTTSLSEVVGELADVAEIERRLADLIVGLLGAIPSREDRESPLAPTNT